MHGVRTAESPAPRAFSRTFRRGLAVAALGAACATIAGFPATGLAQEPPAGEAPPEGEEVAPLALRARAAELRAVPPPFRPDPAHLRRVAGLDVEQRRAVALVGARLARRGFDAAADAAWRALVRDAAPALGRDPEPLVQAVLLEAYLTTQRDLEALVEETGNDDRLARMDLENARERRRRTLRMLSDIAGLLHDTGMAVIRKIDAPGGPATSGAPGAAARTSSRPRSRGPGRSRRASCPRSP